MCCRCFGRALVDSGFSTRVGFVPLAIGGTILANDWVPGRESRWCF